jgi:hypothetical protein
MLCYTIRDIAITCYARCYRLVQQGVTAHVSCSITDATAHMRCYTLTTGIMQDYTPCTTISCYYYYMHCYKLKALIHAMLHAMLQATRHIHRCKSEKERRHFCFLISTFLALAQHSLAQHNHMMN